MKDFFPEKYFSIRDNYYLLNVYKHMIKSKFLHFFFSFIEILLNILQELNIFLNMNNSAEISEKNLMNFMIQMSNKTADLSPVLKFGILFTYTLLFVSLYIFLTRRKFHRRLKRCLALFNILEFLYFRTLMLMYLNLFFSLKFIYLMILFILNFPNIILIKNHFLHNHLYYFVPIFIDFPYDVFSSLYDIILLCIKLLLSIIINTSNITLKKFTCILIFIIQIFYSLYFINLLLNHSYLFMKNYFLNISKVCLFFSQTLILIIAEFVEKKGLFDIYFSLIIVGVIIVLLIFMNLKYEPKNFIKFNTDTTNENLLFYLYIVSEKCDINFLLLSKINEHYQKCEICNLCRRFEKYLKMNSNDTFEGNNNNIEMNLFHVLYENKNEYFKLINEIILNYKYNKKKLFMNSAYYYINLCFLFFSELKIDNINLSLNIKLILDILNQENKYLDDQEFEINQIIFCNKYITLITNILNQLKDILTTDNADAKKYIDLSNSLAEMNQSKNKETLSTNFKQESHSNLKNMIMICSILYEEIFNITINSSQIPIRENYQILDEIFLNNIGKNNKIISLSVNLMNKNCKIIRAGKDLHKYKDNSLFDLFPLIFKDNQTNFFLLQILNGFNSEAHNNQSNNRHDFTKIPSITKKGTIKFKDKKIKIKKPNDFIEIKLIICESFSTKIFYKLLILKLYPLFDYNFNNYFLLFDGTFHLHKNTIMTFQKFESRQNNNPKIVAVSKFELENPPEIYSMKYEKYLNWLDKNDFLLNKLFEYKFSKYLYTIYSIHIKNNVESKQKLSNFNHRESLGDMEYSELKSGLNIKKRIKNFINEETASVASKQVSNNNYIINSSGYGIKNKRKQNMYRYSSLYKIKNTLMFSIPVIALSLILEIIHLIQLTEINIKNDYSILKFDEIYKTYFKLFSNTLNTACIKTENKCKSIAQNYIINNENYNFFDFYLFLSAQNKLFLDDLLSKKSNLLAIHQNLGNEKFQEIFEEKVIYKRISKIFINGTLNLRVSEVVMPFSEAILIIFNSFLIIVNNTKNEPIYILNKTTNPFLYLNEEEIQNFTDYQKEVSEMILNYKIFKNNFILINQKFIDTLAKESQKIEIYIYLYFNMTLFICIYILVLLYVYLRNFEIIIVKILNYVNMVKNYKNDKFDFSKLFLEKIENLEIILNIYAANPLKAMQNLNSLYNKYQKVKTCPSKVNTHKITKKDYKKFIEKENKKDELDMVPINQRIFKIDDIRKLNIIYYYFLFYFIICLFILVIYIIIIFLWVDYSKVKTNLYSLIRKNLDLEIASYKVINLYDLIIFNNLTIAELSKDIFYSPDKNIYNRETLLNSFYDDLFIAFSYENELFFLSPKLKHFPALQFTCKNIYEENNDYIWQLFNYSYFKNFTELKNNLIEICKFSRLAEYSEIAAVFQKHFQDIKNAIISIDDYTFEGIINHLKKGNFGNIIINYNCILIYILNIISDKMHKIEIDDLILLFKDNLIITLIITFLFYFFLIIIMRLLYVRKLKIYCNKVILLKKIFKISEMQEQ